MKGEIKMAKQFIVTVNGKSYEVKVEEKTGTPTVSQVTTASDLEPEVNTARAFGQPITAPMGGMVKDILVKVGDRISDGTVVAIVEVMKMDTEVIAESAGVVEAILAKTGDNLESGAVIATIK